MQNIFNMEFIFIINYDGIFELIKSTFVRHIMFQKPIL